jgi:uncharacterized protein (TIGR00730 family)
LNIDWEADMSEIHQQDYRAAALDPDILATPFKVQTNWHVITGAPSSGKSTLVDQLAEKGYLTAPEAAREYYEQEMANGREIEEIRSDMATCVEGILGRMLEIERGLDPDEAIFLDRGIPDVMAFVRQFEMDPNEILTDCFHHRYASVFMLDRLPVHQDGLRLEDEADTEYLDEWHVRDYTALGYRVVRVPVLPPEERLAFVLEKLAEQGMNLPGPSWGVGSSGEDEGKLKRICVYCAASARIDRVYFEATERLAQLLARRDIEVVFGGAGVGLMGQLADSVIENGGKIKGIIPRFMKERGWFHPLVTELEVTETMHERKARYLVGVDGLVALPGGCGTLEELLEAITWKRLGLYTGPIVIVNTNGYYEPLKAMLQRCVSESFMDERHLDMWTFVDEPEEVLGALENAPDWGQDAIEFAAG